MQGTPRWGRAREAPRIGAVSGFVGVRAWPAGIMLAGICAGTITWQGAPTRPASGSPLRPCVGGRRLRAGTRARGRARRGQGHLGADAPAALPRKVWSLHLDGGARAWSRVRFRAALPGAV